MNARHGVLLMAWIGILPLSASEAREKTRQAEEPEWVDVELFDAIDAGQVRTAVVADGFSQMTLRVFNVTPTPLRIAVPEVFAALPVARQQAQKTLQQQGVPDSLAYGYAQNFGGSQGLGGSLAGPWSQQTGQVAAVPDASDAGDRQAPGRVWLVPPGAPIQFRVPCFCLEYGKPDPNRRIPYQLTRLTDLNGSPAVRELLERFGQGGCEQRVAQLAVWHVANGVPWAMLARLELPRGTGRGTRNVTPVELLAARQLAESLPSYGQSGSLGQP
jgi:hypothetical protein